MPIFTDILLGFEALTTGAGLFEKNKSSNVRDTQLQMREVQDNMKAIQQASREQGKEVKTMSQQAADEAVTGFDAASPSYKAISMTSFDAFLNDQNATATNNQFQQNMLEAQRQDNQTSKNASMFRMLSNFGMEAITTTKTVGKTADSKGA